MPLINYSYSKKNIIFNVCILLKLRSEFISKEVTDAQLLEPLGESFYMRPGPVQDVPRPRRIAKCCSNHRFIAYFSKFFVETHAFSISDFLYEPKSSVTFRKRWR